MSCISVLGSEFFLYQPQGPKSKTTANSPNFWQISGKWVVAWEGAWRTRPLTTWKQTGEVEGEGRGKGMGWWWWCRILPKVLEPLVHFILENWIPVPSTFLPLKIWLFLPFSFNSHRFLPGFLATATYLVSCEQWLSGCGLVLSPWLAF